MHTQNSNFAVTRQDGVAVLHLDVPDRTMNVVDASVIDELATILDTTLTDDDVRGIVLTSGKPGAFGAGADLKSLPELANDPGTTDFLVRTHALMERMADSPKPIVAAIDGYALGGALEIALGASTILVTPSARLGLPESTLGLIPGGGGTQLILRRVEPTVAIEMMVAGATLSAEKAVAAGLADDIVDADSLLATAIEIASTGQITPRPHPTPDLKMATEVEAAAAAVRRPPSAGAATALVQIVSAGVTVGRSAGLAAEREYFLRLLRGDESAALIHMFHVETDAKRRFRGTSLRPTTMAVVGAGQMGAGIAATAAAHGINAVVRDIDEGRIAEARDRAAKAGSDDTRAAWSGTTDWARFAEADAVVEAVFESPDLKRDTLAQVDAQVGPDTLITTNTSAIPIAGLADAVSRPERFLGTHFFSPVEKMPLVELVPHDRTAAASVDRAGAIARALGKLPVVVADYPGFFTSRVYARWLLEGLRLLVDGADPALIEKEAREVGFPVGPLQASDEVTLQLVMDASIVQVAERVLTDRVDVPAIKDLANRLLEAGVRGKRFGQGFYNYQDGRRAGINPDVVAVAAPAGASVPAGVAGERLLLAFVTESLLCWDDATLCHPDDGDLAAVLGIGFPRALGGPFHWIDRQGAAAVLARCQAFDDKAFPVGDTLPRLADVNGRFIDEARRDGPGTPGSRLSDQVAERV